MRFRLVVILVGGMSVATSVRHARAEGPSAPKHREEPAVVPEPYLTSGFTYYGSNRRVIAGLGGGLGYRLNLGRHFAAYLEARRLVYIGSSFTGASGVMFRYRYRGWEPILGVQAAGYHGDRLEVISSSSPAPPPPVTWAVQARLGLLRFVDERFTATALALDWGYGADSGALGTAIGVTLIDIGFRL